MRRTLLRKADSEVIWSLMTPEVTVISTLKKNYNTNCSTEKMQISHFLVNWRCLLCLKQHIAIKGRVTVTNEISAIDR